MPGYLGADRATSGDRAWQARRALEGSRQRLACHPGAAFADSDAHPGRERPRLIASVEGEAMAEPRQLRFRAGRRSQSWVGNVVAIGLASGFLEPLESTSIYLAQGAITQLIDLFPIGRATDQDRAEYNHMVDLEYDRIRDFLILHYHATTRDDSPFWDHVRTMQIPDSLRDKMSLWRESGRVSKYSHGLFFEPSWIAVYVGQGLVPRHWDVRADAAEPGALAAALDQLRQRIAGTVAAMPDHADFLARRA